MAAPLLILLPPSEAKTPGGTLRPGVGAFDDALGDDRRRVIEALVTALNRSSTRRREILLNARGPLLERALETTRQLDGERVPRLAAWQRYSGVVWSHLGPASLTPALRRRFKVVEALRSALFSQMVVVPLYHRHGILTQVAADNMNVVKLLPPLVAGDEEVEHFAEALDDVLASAERGSSLMVEFGKTMAMGTLHRVRR